MKKILLLTFLCLSINSFGLERIFPLTEEDRSLYSKVYEEVQYVLQKNHFNNDISLRKSKIVEKYINQVDSQKTIFTENEIESFSIKPLISPTDEINLAFMLFSYYKERSINLLEHQKSLIELVENEEDLNGTEIVYKNREDLDRFKSYSQIKTYQQNLALSELISIYLKENDLTKAKEKIIKRLNNRKKSLNRISSDEIFSLYINSYTDFYDPHTNYMTPTTQEDWEINLKASLEGIGAILSSEDGITKITRLIPGGPAEKSGLLKVTDKIVGVGKSINDNVVDVRDWRIDEVVKLIRGPKSTVVQLEVLPAASDNEDKGKLIEITRDVVKLEDAAAKKKEIEIKRASRNYNIGVIELPTFYMDFEAYNKNRFDYKSSSRDVKKILRELDESNIDGLVLDLRGNGGGFLYEAYSLAKLFIGRGNVVQVMEANGSLQSLGHNLGQQNYDGPIVILVDKLSASASEILAGVIQDYDRGLVIGSQTFGKGTVQRMIELSHGHLKFTEQKYYRVSGESTQNKGVEPDITIPLVFDDEEIGERSYENSLPYNHIDPIFYRSFNNVENVDLLKTTSSNRTDSNEMSIYINSQQEFYEIEKNNNEVPINLEIRKIMKLAREEKILKMENKFRKSLNLDPFVTYDEFVNSDPEEISELREGIVLKEAAEILVDSIQLKEAPSRLSFGILNQ
ncbi:MAG: carboxy terminal-processing peptidase [Gammaproteobacteria bacterium]